MRYSEMIRSSWSAGRRMLFALAVFGIVGLVGCDSVTAPEVHSSEQVRAGDDRARENGTRDGSGSDASEQEAESGKRTDTGDRPYRPKEAF